MLISNTNAGGFVSDFSGTNSAKLYEDIMNMAVYDSTIGTLRATHDLVVRDIGRICRAHQPISTSYNGTLGVMINKRVYRTIDLIFLMAQKKLPPYGGMYFADGNESNLRWNNIWLDYAKCANDADQVYWEKRVDERYANN